MKIADLKLAAESIEQLKRLAAAHNTIASGDVVGLDVGPLEGPEVPDHLWDEATEAAEKVILKGIERMFEQQAAALTKAGIEDVPTLKEFKSS